MQDLGEAPQLRSLPKARGYLQALAEAAEFYEGASMPQVA